MASIMTTVTSPSPASRADRVRPLPRAASAQMPSGVRAQLAILHREVAQANLHEALFGADPRPTIVPAGRAQGATKIVRL